MNTNKKMRKFLRSIFHRHALRVVLILSTIVIVPMGCQEATTEPEVSVTDEYVIEQVIDNYYGWARLSRNKDYNGMINLVAPQSSFEGATGVCKDMWDMGGDFYYEFSSVDVQYTQEKPPEAVVYGNWLLYQRPANTGSPVINEGGFYSDSYPVDGEFYGDEWRLDGINWNKDKNWWK